MRCERAIVIARRATHQAQDQAADVHSQARGEEYEQGVGRIACAAAHAPPLGKTGRRRDLHQSRSVRSRSSPRTNRRDSRDPTKVTGVKRVGLGLEPGVDGPCRHRRLLLGMALADRQALITPNLTRLDWGCESAQAQQPASAASRQLMQLTAKPLWQIRKRDAGG